MLDITSLGWYELHRLLKAVINLMVCAPLWFSCVCRLNLMSKDTALRVFRWKYVVLMVMTGLSGVSPLIADEWPTWTRIGFEISVLFVMHGGRRAWVRGVPLWAAKGGALSDWANLDEA